VGNGNGSLLLILVLFAILLFASSRSRRRLQRQREETLSRLQAGAQVVTSSGLHASVVEVLDDGTVRLETAPGQVSRWDRMAVARVEPPVTESVTESAAEPGAEPLAEPGIEPAVQPGIEPRGVDGVQDNAPPDRA
jgi:preprotein translocase YajC subunit